MNRADATCGRTPPDQIATGPGHDPNWTSKREKRKTLVFGEQTYELLVRDVDPVVVTWSGRKTPAVKVAFQTRGLSTGNRSRFELTAGTAGDTAGVPMTIEWQPRWWLKVRLRLEDPHRVP